LGYSFFFSLIVAFIRKKTVFYEILVEIVLEMWYNIFIWMILGFIMDKKPGSE